MIFSSTTVHFVREPVSLKATTAASNFACLLIPSLLICHHMYDMSAPHGPSSQACKPSAEPLLHCRKEKATIDLCCCGFKCNDADTVKHGHILPRSQQPPLAQHLALLPQSLQVRNLSPALCVALPWLHLPARKTVLGTGGAVCEI